jgi:hypothetical protein
MALEHGDLVLDHFGKPQKASTFMASPEYRKLDQDVQFFAGVNDPTTPIPELPGHASIILGSRNNGVFVVAGWIGPCSETIIPIWIFFFIVSVPPLAALGYAIAHAEQFRRPEGYCRRCSYDLRGNTSGTCPECGTKWK